MKTTMPLLVLAAALAGIAAPWSGAAASTFTVYDSDASTFVPPTSIAGDNLFHVLYSVDVGTLNVGDILIVFSEAQLQNPATTSVFRLTSHLIRANSTSATSGTALDDSNAFNITPADYRGAVVKPAVLQVTGSVTNHFVNLVVQATGDLDVVDNTGRLQILKITP